MKMIFDTMERGAKSILAFIIILSVLLNSFTMTAYIIYGPRLEIYRTYIKAFTTLFVMITGEIAYYEDMQKVAPIFTPFFFLTFMFLTFFVLINLFVAILNEAFAVVVGQQVSSKDKQALTSNLLQLKKEAQRFKNIFCSRCRECCKRRKNVSRSKANRAFN
jgi:ABC-type multidrug transport system fused ATPase/permease subunit